MSALASDGPTPVSRNELRLLHEIGSGDGRPFHWFRKRPGYRPGDSSYYECRCGAQADRFRNQLPDEDEPWPLS